MVSHHYAGLEVDEDIRFERKSWTFQRVGRFGLATFLILAFLGLTGSGPLSNASASTPDDSLSISYERIDRINSPSTLQINFLQGLSSGGQLEVWVESDFLNNVQLEQITPEPESVDIDAERYVFTFAVSAETDPAPISIHFMHERPGISRASVGIVDGPSVSFRQLVFP